MAPLRNDAVRAQVAHAESLLERVESLEQETARAVALECVQALLQLYGEALARILACARSGGGEVALLEDELVSHLLLVHDLHPADVRARIERALDEVRPYLGSHGGTVELLEVRDGVARVRLGGGCNGCPSSALTLRSAIEGAIAHAAPEVERIEAEGIERREDRPEMSCDIELRGGGAAS